MTESRTLPEAHIAHISPRRIRLRIPCKKGNVNFFGDLSVHLAQCPGVSDVEVNWRTGSALLLTASPLSMVVKYGMTHGLFRLKPPTPVHKSLVLNVTEAFKAYDRSLRNFTGGEIDIPSVIFLSLLISGVIQIARGNFVMPAWYTAFYYALGIFTRVKEADADIEEASWEAIGDE